MEHIEQYRNSESVLLRKIPSKIYYCNIITIFSLIFFILFSIFYKYNKYIDYYGIIANDKIEFYTNIDFYQFSNMKLLINNSEYVYQIKSIDPFSYYNSEIEYWKITIEIDIPEKWNIENNRLLIRFIKEKTNYMNEIIKFIKKGIK